MSNYNSLKATINANIKTNGNQEITGSVLNSVLTAMVNTIGSGYQYAGIATPSTNPGTPDYKAFYIASKPGTYIHMGGIVVGDGEIVILRWDTSWTKDATDIASVDSIVSISQVVSDIDARLNGYDGSNPFKIIGKRYKTDGTIIDDAGCRITERIPLFALKDYLIYGIQLSSGSFRMFGELDYCVAVFFDGDRNFIGYSQDGSTFTPSHPFPFSEIPQNAEYVAFSTLTDYLGNDTELVTNPGVLDYLYTKVGEIDGLSEDIYGETHSINIEKNVIGGYTRTPLDEPLGVGMIITGYEADPSNMAVWLGDDLVKLNLSAATFPLTLTDNYNAVFCESNGVVKIYGNDGSGLPDKVGLKDQVETLQDEVDQLVGDIYSEIHTFKVTKNVIENYARIPLDEPLKSGMVITGYDSDPNMAVWLGDESVKLNLSAATFPLTLTDNYTAVFGGANGVVNIYGNDGSGLPDKIGIKDKVDTLQDEVDEIISDVGNMRKVVRILSSDSQYDVFTKMYGAFLEGNCDVFFDKATYTLDNVYNQIKSVLGTWTVGLPIGNNCRYYFNGSTIISNPPSDQWSESRNVLDCQASSQNFEIYDAILINNGGRYCVHDEGDGDTTPYIHKYQNIRMIYNETSTTPDTGAKPFGCGLGYDATLCFDGCYFEHSNPARDAFSIHGVTDNNRQIVFRMSMKNSYIKHTTMVVVLLDKLRDIIEYYLSNNCWGQQFDGSESTSLVEFGNIVI